MAALPENAGTTPRIKLADIVLADDELGMNVPSLCGADAGLFEIDGSTLYLRAVTVLDFEARPVLSATVHVDDASLGTVPADSVLAVLNINERPEVAKPIPGQSATENVAFRFQRAGRRVSRFPTTC